MQLKLDTVSGTEFNVSSFDGRYIRTGLIIVNPGELPPLIPNPRPVVNALAASGMPQPGDTLPVPGYEEWIVRRHIIRAITATIYTVSIIYEWLGVLRIRDTSTLTMEMSQIHPGTKKPIPLNYTRPGANNQAIKKVARLPLHLPMRHLVLSKTVQYEARVEVLNAFGSVNKLLWEGLGPGFWLFSGLDGDSFDNGVTYTYTVTVSTRQVRDWSEFAVIEDDRGNAITFTTVEQQAVFDVISQAYAYNVNTNANGFIRAGMQAMTDFGPLFGIGAP